MGDYTKYINLVISDSSMNHFQERGIDFSSFNSFANHIKNRLLLKDINSVGHFLNLVINDVVFVFGLNIREATELVTRYYLHDLWGEYYEVTKLARSCFGTFLIN